MVTHYIFIHVEISIKNRYVFVLSRKFDINFLNCSRCLRRRSKRLIHIMLEFGELPIRIRKVVYFTLCATHQKSWAKAISHGLPNFFKRSGRAMMPMAPGNINYFQSYA